jgi:hypothetical protein
VVADLNVHGGLSHARAKTADHGMKEGSRVNDLNRGALRPLRESFLLLGGSSPALADFGRWQGHPPSRPTSP